MPTFPGKRYSFTEDGFNQLTKDLMYYLNNLDGENVTASELENINYVGSSAELTDKAIYFYDAGPNEAKIAMTSDAALSMQSYKEVILKGSTITIDSSNGIYIGGSSIVFDSSTQKATFSLDVTTGLSTDATYKSSDLTATNNLLNEVKNLLISYGLASSS